MYMFSFGFKFIYEIELVLWSKICHLFLTERWEYCEIAFTAEQVCRYFSTSHILALSVGLNSPILVLPTYSSLHVGHLTT